MAMGIPGSKKWLVPVTRPPTRAETDAWLEEETGHRTPQHQHSCKHGATPDKAGQGSGFAMDANTGKLIPVGTDLSQVGMRSMCHKLAICRTFHIQKRMIAIRHALLSWESVLKPIQVQ